MEETTKPTELTLPEFSGKYVILAIVVGSIRFVWSNASWAIGGVDAIPLDSVAFDLAEGGLVTIGVLSLYGKCRGRPFFREPGHWFACMIAIYWIGGFFQERFIVNSMVEFERRDLFLLTLYDHLIDAYVVSLFVLGALFLRFFFGYDEIADTWPWRMAMLFMGVSGALASLFGLHISSQRLHVVELLEGAAMATALFRDNRNQRHRHWTHTAAICCWLCRSVIRGYWYFW